MTEFSERARRLATAAKRAGLIEPSQPPSEPTMVPLNRRYRPVNELSDDQLSEALRQAQARIDRTPPTHVDYERFAGILATITAATAERASHPLVELTPPPTEGPNGLLVEDDGESEEGEELRPLFSPSDVASQAADLDPPRFSPHPLDTPESA